MHFKQVKFLSLDASIQRKEMVYLMKIFATMLPPFPLIVVRPGGSTVPVPLYVSPACTAVPSPSFQILFRKMRPEFHHHLIVIGADHPELGMKIRQPGVIIHQRPVHFQHSERLSEEVRFQENGLRTDTRMLEHREETVVSLLAEPYRVTCTQLEFS